VSGRVQGVAFRYYTLQSAQDLALAGWVRNLRDGRVEVEFEGKPEAVRAMEAWLRRGPPSAVVRDVELTELAPRGEKGFEIRDTQA
jgi:acylphosphatase